MTAVSSPELVIAACRSGVIGSFPTHNAATERELDAWLHRMTADSGATAAPIAPNLVVHRSNARRDSDLAVLLRHRVEMVITSVGSPEPVIGPLHDAGAQVFADVASLEHARRAIDAGADGLVLLTAGAGGQTGWANPFAFVRAVRERFDGPVVLAGGISDGRAILAAQVLGADLVYLGTRFIATHQSAADDAYRSALVTATLDDVRLSDRVGGIPASLLSSWLDAQRATQGADAPPQDGFAQDRLLANRGAWSAGHSVSGVHDVVGVEELVDELVADYTVARDELKVVTDG
ncbi:NAD(P)H-dependent flavin oxidoreductase [Mycolicibacterium pyrenivorans]|uniref:NAD(P)H-dependent flavin oxidoreductase n=1 Tax=Mycolicibacterium pyrenivorans TaxID=187102 RepID=UPI0021F2D8E7|nr:nitronate monooxygenase [Mycolicibacterium pyrenivorans]MCV7154899.1 nitronate monooxygenase [Mycolicibacterium pyrenivorans]